MLIQKLFNVNLFGGIKLGLDNCHKLSKLLRYPDKSFKSIHIAGTNGKGSVTKKIASALEAEGFRVGQYTSPHISCFRERISINGKMISEQAIEELLPKIFQICEKEHIPATFFEITTLLSFDYFAREKVDYAVIETGLGGRLDATNIVLPILSVITSISLEHTEILGNTLEQIAEEKAGIIKPKTSVILGPRLPTQIFLEIANKHQSPYKCVTGVFDNFEEENCAIAQAALELLNISSRAITSGLKARMPCRMEILTERQLQNLQIEPCPSNVILDVAHNPDGLNRLFEAAHQKFPDKPFRVICGLSKTKDVVACLTILKQNSSHLYLVEAPNGRGASPSELNQILLNMNTPEEQISTNSSIQDTVQTALNESFLQKEILIICGTFFIMGEVRKALNIQEPKDNLDLN